MNELSFWLEVFTISVIAYELSRLISISCGDVSMPWYISALFHVLYVVGLLGLFTVGIVESRIGKIIYDRHIEQLKKLRVIAELHGYPDALTEQRYDLDCSLYRYGEEFDIYSWKRHEYEKLGL